MNNKRYFIVILIGPSSIFETQYQGPGQMPEPSNFNKFIELLFSQGVLPKFYFVDPLFASGLSFEDQAKVYEYPQGYYEIIPTNIQDFIDNNQELINSGYPTAVIDYTGLNYPKEISDLLGMDYLNPNHVYIIGTCQGCTFNPFNLLENSKYRYDFETNRFNRPIYNYLTAGKIPDYLVKEDKFYVFNIVAQMVAYSRAYNFDEIPEWAQYIPAEISLISGTLRDLSPREIKNNLITYLNMFMRNNYPNQKLFNDDQINYDITSSKLSELQNFILKQRQYL